MRYFWNYGIDVRTFQTASLGTPLNSNLLDGNVIANIVHIPNIIDEQKYNNKLTIEKNDANILNLWLIQNLT